MARRSIRSRTARADLWARVEVNSLAVIGLPRDLRRAIAIEAAERGWPIWEVEKLLGTMTDAERRWYDRNCQVAACRHSEAHGAPDNGTRN